MKRMTIMIRTLAICLCILLTLSMPLCLSSCAAKQVPLLTLEEESISVNHYRILQSRLKGLYMGDGHDVSSESFWDQYVPGNITYDQHVREQVLRDAKQYLAASVLFTQKDLSLPESTLDEIDSEIDGMIISAGSKRELNAELAAYGANIDILRELYVIEAKYEYVQDHLYGADGSKVSDALKQEYVEKHTVAFKQLLIRGYKYVYETDANNDEIYYLTDANTGKVNNIAYDKDGGVTRLDDKGNVITDKNGDAVYYTPDGKISYDRKNGTRAVKLDALGKEVTVPYSADENTQHKEIANEISTAVTKSNSLGFELLAAEYGKKDADLYVWDDELCFLYDDVSDSYLEDLSVELFEMSVGDVRVVPSEYGYHVVMKYKIPSDAASDTTYADWFSDLTDRVIAKSFYEQCKPLIDAVVVDEEAYATLPTMKETAVNMAY